MSSSVLFLSSKSLPRIPCSSNHSTSSSLSLNNKISVSLFNTHFPILLKTPQKHLLNSHKPLKILSSQAETINTTNDSEKSELSSSITNFSVLSEPFLKTNNTLKIPTAPWMKGPLLVPANEVLDLSRMKTEKGRSKDEKFERNDASLTEKVSGGRGRQAMRRIVESITRLQEFQSSDESQKKLEEFELRVPIESICEDGSSKVEARMPWVTEEKFVFRRMKKEKVVTNAEVSLSEMVLKRLRNDARKMKKWVKVKKAGVTEAVVHEIKRAWIENELAMVKFDVPLRRNMDRAREIIELKTGGLVVWSKKDTHVVYRGCDHVLSSKACQKLHSDHAYVVVTSPLDQKSVRSEGKADVSYSMTSEITQDEKGSTQKSSSAFIEENFGLESVSGTLYEREGDRLLNGLGPRFVDWWWPKPLPVDADLLPEVVPGYMTPFRRCPPHVRPNLTDDELTNLRRLARSLPTHFALGRNTKLQGLATAMIKLWERSLIAKIAVKWGIPNTNNELMAQELKELTGGVLILRNKFFIIFFRGKDFLPSGVADLVMDRETELKSCQQQEEGARGKAMKSCYVADEKVASSSNVGTYSEFQYIQTKYHPLSSEPGNSDIQLATEKERLQKELRSQEHKLFILKKKIEKSAKELSKLNAAWQPSDQCADQEMITEEERQCLRKIGLKMNKTLMLGRRGIFDGVVGSMHLHWKHREIVKVITMQRRLSQVHDTAIMLQIESGGILISVEKLSEGHAIIMYRGKNYKRPLNLWPGNLLKKRPALHRSLEMQRIGSLKFFANQRQRRISDLKLKLKGLEDKADEAFLEESSMQES